MRKNMGKMVGIGALGMATLMLPMMGLGSGQAGAACAMNWEKMAGDSGWSVNACNGLSNDGTFTSKISDDQIITVTLNNYRGGAFQLMNYGTGMPIKKVVFNLAGENEVTAENGIAFLTSTPTEFTGEGSLKMKALIPALANSDYVTENYQRVQVTDLLKDYVAYWSDRGGATSEITIKPTVKTEEPTEKPEEKPEGNEGDAEEGENKGDENCVNGGMTDNTEKENPWTTEMITLHVAAGIYILLSLVAFIAMGINKIRRKTQPKETKKIVIEEQVEKSENGEKIKETKEVKEKK